MFFSFEGIEGTGKSTQLARLATALRSCGIDPLVTREPGGTELGRRLRQLLLEPTARPMAPGTELLLYAADRAEHVATVIEPALEGGRVVLCDRYVDATLAYQGYGRELGVESIQALHAAPPLDLRPHRTLLYDLDPGQALTRAVQRNQQQGVDETEGRFEQEALDFHRRVRQGYLNLARDEPGRFRIIDGSGTPEEVELRTRAAVEDLLPCLRLEPSG